MGHVAVIRFPGSNCDQDAVRAVQQAGGRARLVWHAEHELSGADAVILPGGFSWGDYLRCGAMAARAPIMAAVAKAARGGVPVLGICNGFQILTEAGLLPGALLRNAHLRFTCRQTQLVVESADTPFTCGWAHGERVALPVAHAEGRYHAGSDADLARLEANGQVVLRYATGQNPNGSRADVAGVCNEARNVVGMMPHPERATSELLGSADGTPLFDAIVARTLEGAHV
jgi:phosphoribosylformylglycinamidine synthase